MRSAAGSGFLAAEFQASPPVSNTGGTSGARGSALRIARVREGHEADVTLHSNGCGFNPRPVVRIRGFSCRYPAAQCVLGIRPFARGPDDNGVLGSPGDPRS